MTKKFLFSLSRLQQYSLERTPCSPTAV